MELRYTRISALVEIFNKKWKRNKVKLLSEIKKLMVPKLNNNFNVCGTEKD